MAEYNAGAGRGKQGGPTAEEIADTEENRMLNDRADARKLEKQMEVQQGGKVYMGDPYAKPASQRELNEFEKNSKYPVVYRNGRIEKPDPVDVAAKDLVTGLGRGLERGLDAALPMRKMVNMAVSGNITDRSKKQYDKAVKTFNETLTDDERAVVKTELKKRLNKGGKVSSRADGIAQRGKTRGKMC